QQAADMFGAEQRLHCNCIRSGLGRRLGNRLGTEIHEANSLSRLQVSAGRRRSQLQLVGNGLNSIARHRISLFWNIPGMMIVETRAPSPPLFQYRAPTAPQPRVLRRTPPQALCGKIAFWTAASHNLAATAVWTNRDGDWGPAILACSKLARGDVAA